MHTAISEKIHECLAIKLDYKTPGVLKVDIRARSYVQGMLEGFPYKLTRNVKAPWTKRLFKDDVKAKKPAWNAVKHNVKHFILS